MLKEIK